MTYAEIKAQHVAGKPPGCEPQRVGETYAKYVARMATNGLPPDIDTGESDADYLVRVAAARPAPSPTKIQVSGYNVIGTVATATAATTATLATTANTASYISSSATFDVDKVYIMSASWAEAAGGTP